MTKNQIEYAKLLELRRSNQAQEQVQHRQLDETRRHNMAGEAQAIAVLGETGRSNRANEGLRASELDEKRRAASASEAISTHRINVETALERSRQRETHRSNVAKEVELNRSHRATEQETQRHNLATERVADSRASADWVGTVARAFADAMRGVKSAQTINVYGSTSTSSTSQQQGVDSDVPPGVSPNSQDSVNVAISDKAKQRVPVIYHPGGSFGSGGGATRDDVIAKSRTGKRSVRHG